MPRPKTKQDLLDQSKNNFDQLFNYIEALSASEQNREFPPGSLNRNIRDLPTHLHHWHLMMLTWYDLGMSGQKPVMPAKGYTWKDLPALNTWINEHYKNTTLKESKSLVKQSYLQVRNIINGHSYKERFEKK